VRPPHAPHRDPFAIQLLIDAHVFGWRANGISGSSPRPPSGRRPVDRVACPWLVRRFIDPAAEFLFRP
jgi:hypothetical protein